MYNIQYTIYLNKRPLGCRSWVEKYEYAKGRGKSTIPENL